MQLKDLVKSYRNAHNLSQRQFARRCELSNGYISMLENDLNPKTGLPLSPSIVALKRIANGMGISLNELLSSVDDMSVDVSLLEDAPTDTTTIPTAKNIIPMPQMNKIPLLGTIACGTPILAVENVEEEVFIPENIKADFALRCKGDSMIGAEIYDGDIVYIRRQEEVIDGQIAAVLIEDEATLKRVYYDRDANEIRLAAENPKVKTLLYQGESLNHIKILGKAVGLTRSLAN